MGLGWIEDFDDRLEIGRGFVTTDASSVPAPIARKRAQDVLGKDDTLGHGVLRCILVVGTGPIDSALQYENLSKQRLLSK